MNQNAITFLEQLSADRELLSNMLSTEESSKRILALAKDNGVTDEDLRSLVTLELDAQALDDISGGTSSQSSSTNLATELVALSRMMLGNKSQFKDIQKQSTSGGKTDLPVIISLLPPGQ